MRSPTSEVLAYVRASSRGPPTLTGRSCSAVFLKSQNLRNAGSLCTMEL